jgi:hypothetical protein
MLSAASFQEGNKLLNEVAGKLISLQGERPGKLRMGTPHAVTAPGPNFIL